MVESTEIQAAFKETEVGIIPSDWEVKMLGELGFFKNGINKGKEDFGHGSPFVNLMDVFGKNFIDGSVELDLINSNDAEKQLYSIQEGDVIFVRSSVKPSGVGLTILVKEDLPNTVFSGFLIRFREKNQLDKQYKIHCFYEEGFRKRVIAGATVSANTNINQEVLKSLLLPFPPTLTEQTAIATALNDADALITQLEKLIAKKRAIKQGTMQEMLKPKEGWEVKRLGEVLRLQGGYSFKSAFFTKLGIPIIRISDIDNNNVDVNHSVYYNAFDISREFIAERGNILIAMSGATTGKIGVYDLDEIAYINQRVGKFVILNHDVTSQVYISHLVRSEKFTDGLFRQIAQGAQPNISGKQIENIELPFPASLHTQIQTARILSDMDAEIELLEKKLAKYQLVKQGMMQNLLTGKIRLV